MNCGCQDPIVFGHSTFCALPIDWDAAVKRAGEALTLRYKRVNYMVWGSTVLVPQAAISISTV